MLKTEQHSILLIDDEGRRLRLPTGDPASSHGSSHTPRICREVCTERDVFHAGGTFYELPAPNAGGFLKLRPVATHTFAISDYCSWRGLLVLSGIARNSPPNPHIIRSEDGKAAVWLGTVDDLWRIGKARGRGAPWPNITFRQGVPSDPYLCNGFDQKKLVVSHTAAHEVGFSIEADFTGQLDWNRWHTVMVPAGQQVTYDFPDAFSAYWLRLTASHDCEVSAELIYY